MGDTYGDIRRDVKILGNATASHMIYRVAIDLTNNELMYYIWKGNKHQQDANISMPDDAKISQYHVSQVKDYAQNIDALHAQAWRLLDQWLNTDAAPTPINEVF